MKKTSAEMAVDICARSVIMSRSVYHTPANQCSQLEDLVITDHHLMFHRPIGDAGMDRG